MRTLVTSLVLGLWTAAAAGQTPGLHRVGLPPGGTGSDGVRGLSQDGTIAVGTNAAGPLVAFRWTLAGGREDYGLLPGMPTNTRAFGISGDGNVIAGSIVGNPIESASVRMGNSLVQDLGVLPGHHSSRALAVSGDGAIVVGQNMAGSGTNYTSGQAFMWTAQTGMQPMPHLRPGGSLTQARGISRDGTTIVGMSQFGGTGGPIEAFRWTQAGGMVPLPTLPGGSFSGLYANAASADGSVIVGAAASATPQSDGHATRWEGGIAQDLGVLQGARFSTAYAVSDDGLVIGGSSQVGSTSVPFVWTPALGMIPLADHLASSGVIIPQGWTLKTLWAISGDGQTFGGEVRSAAGIDQGFVATVPAPSGMVAVSVLAALYARRHRSTQ